MASIVLMPQKGVSEESAVMSKWYVKVGDKVKIGQSIFALETGKASFDVEAETEGEILAFLCEEGDELPIEAPVCVIGTKGEKFDVPGKPSEVKADEAPAKEGTPEAKAESVKPVEAAEVVNDGFIAASPRAKLLASRAGVSLQYIKPTGPEGRIIERDVNKYLDEGRPVPEVKAAPAETEIKVEAKAEAKAETKPATEYEDKPISPVRNAIAKNMMTSLSTMAQLTLNSSFDATSILAFRKECKANSSLGLEKLTIGDFISFAVSRTLPDFPELNAHFLGDKMRYYKQVNLGFACDTPKGLLVPVIAGADKLSLLEISKKTKELAKKAQDGALSRSEMSGGSFTVSNLGIYGIESFTPVINPPQTGILGVNNLQTRVREVDGEIKTYQAMGLSLTFDHRALDGVPAAKFLKALCANLESFTLLLAK